MRQLSIFSALLLLLLASAAIAQKKPVHPADLYACMGENSKWVDRYVRAEYGIKPERETMGGDTIRLSFYNALSDVEVSMFLVDDVCEFIGFNDYSLNENNINTYFTRWCTDVTDHMRFISEKSERYPMFEDASYNMVFYIPEAQSDNTGLKYYMFSGFIRSEPVASMN